MYILARNDWCARQLVNRIAQGRAPQNLLHPSRRVAEKKIKSLPAIRQEELGIFEVTIPSTHSTSPKG